mmetsp:Transcript_25736/g.57843  ORF Transcript_25736/g.57843 Transcript_25736/m.57843 type:complete len:371 (-) Transcript_25736:78-1190(-)
MESAAAAKTWEPRDSQLAIIVSVMVLVVTYYAVTLVLPYLSSSLQSASEKRRLIKSIAQEEEVDEARVIAELKSFKGPAKTKAEILAKPVCPSFSLNPTSIRATNGLGVSGGTSTSPAPTRHRTRTTPAFRLKPSALVRTEISEGAEDGTDKPVTGSKVLGRPRSAEPRPMSATPFLGAPSADSIEGRLHAQLKSGASYNYTGLTTASSTDTQSVLAARREREEQDAEYQRCLQADRLRLEQELQEQRASALQGERAQARRTELAEALKQEPTLGDAHAVTLSFRLKLQGGNTATCNFKRIDRRFSVSRDTGQDLLNYVESLEIRPHGQPFQLSLDFPTRVISTESSNERSLQELDICGDSVVWVTFLTP